MPSGFNLFELSLANITDNAMCQNISGESSVVNSWTRYPGVNIWRRLVVWKVPLVLLLLAFLRPPLNIGAQLYTLFHLLGDPIGTISSLLYTLAICQKQAVKLKEHFESFGQERSAYPIWKLYCLIRISYGECGDCGHVEEFIEQSIKILESAPRKHRSIWRLFHETSHSLAADRRTAFLPITYAQLIFVQAFGFAFYNIYHSARITRDNPSGVLLSVEAHSIAMSAPFLWLITAVFLSSIIGTSQTDKNIPRQLNTLRDRLLLLADEVPGNIKENLPEEIRLPHAHGDYLNHSTFKAAYQDSFNHSSSEEHELAVIEGSNGSRNDDLSTTGNLPEGTACVQSSHTKQRPMLNTYERINSGGVYSSISPGTHLLRKQVLVINLVSIFLVVNCVAISVAISWRVPPEGFNCRTIAQLALLVVWAASRSLDVLISYAEADPRRQYLMKFGKDLFTSASIVVIIVITQWGIFNRCDCYTQWGRKPFANQLDPAIALKLNDRFQREWPIIIFIGIVIQLTACGLLTWWYNLAFRVYLQKDENTSNLDMGFLRKPRADESQQGLLWP